MQHHLATQYERAWQIADLIAMHGTHDFSAGADCLAKTVSFYGLTVHFENQMPVRFVAPNLDVAFTYIPNTQPFDVAFKGDGYRTAHAMAGAEYTLNFARGDVAVLGHWYDQLMAFADTVAVPRAA